MFKSESTCTFEIYMFCFVRNNSKLDYKLNDHINSLILPCFCFFVIIFVLNWDVKGVKAVHSFSFNPQQYHYHFSYPCVQSLFSYSIFSYPPFLPLLCFCISSASWICKPFGLQYSLLAML